MIRLKGEYSVLIKQFEDYEGEKVFLSQEVWSDHISEDHPHMKLEVIGSVLNDPEIVCDSQHFEMQNIKLYYQGPWKNLKGKSRYFRVVVKSCDDGNWISTAHIRAKVSCGKILFKAGKK